MTVAVRLNSALETTAASNIATGHACPTHSEGRH
uniref:Uncharacterized protein n=1 Tax=Anopheles dirus TaxID=7168 RepID=A0A182NW51_9DIPT